MTSSNGSSTVGTKKARRSSLSLYTSGNVAEAHKNPIYCVAWSTDVHEVDLPQQQYTSEDDDDTEDFRVDTAANGENEDESFFSTRTTRVFQYMATCAARNVSVYRVERVDVASRRCPKSGTPQMVQAYLDDDEQEDFFCCAFAGRSVVWSSPSAETPTPVTVAGQGVANENVNYLRDIGHRQAPGNSTSNSKSPLQDDVLVLDKAQSYPHKNSKRSNGTRNANFIDDLSTEELRRHFASKYATGPQLLCVGGFRRGIRVIDVHRNRLLATLVGHGDQIYDLQVCPVDEWVLASASRDESIRVWNLRTCTTVAILGGHGGHRDAVISVAWHPLGHYLASSGMDTTVKLWDVREPTTTSQAIAVSHRQARRAFLRNIQELTEPARQQFPIFSTNQVHTHCVDCVRFVGDLILSKSTENKIVLWKPLLTLENTSSSSLSSILLNPPQEILHLRTFEYTHSDYWYFRFATDPMGKYLAVGTGKGQIFVWNLAEHKRPAEILSLRYPDTQLIRCVSFSDDGQILVASTDNGVLWKWDINDTLDQRVTHAEENSDTIPPGLRTP
jgi:polycomb protein EED